MSRLNMKVHATLLKEAKMYFKDVKPLSDTSSKEQKSTVVLTEEHIQEWLEVFYDDRIRMDTCNQAVVKR